MITLQIINKECPLKHVCRVCAAFIHKKGGKYLYWVNLRKLIPKFHYISSQIPLHLDKNLKSDSLKIYIYTSFVDEAIANKYYSSVMYAIFIPHYGSQKL